MGDRELAELAASQDSLVARHQARAHLTRKQLENRLATGRLVVVRRGVYRFAGAPSGPWHELRAAVLAAGPPAVASHFSAAALWEFSGVMSDRPEVTVPWPMRLRLPGVRGHQSRRLPEDHVTRRKGIPVTTPARTLVDLSGRIATSLLGRLVDESVRRGLATFAGVRQVRDEAASRATTLAAITAVLDARQEGYRAGDSPREVHLGRLLAHVGLPPPAAQYQVEAGATVYVLDYAHPELRLGYEYDGWGAHGSRSAFDRDRIRGNALAAAGWTILHITSAMTDEEVAAAARAAYDRLAGTNTPSEGQLRAFEATG